jgi:KUP system potassium uptake protein
VAKFDRLKIEDLGNGFFRLQGVYGFMESPNVPELMEIARRNGFDTDPATTSYYLGRETLLTSGASKMMSWRKALFAFMSRNASNATSYFGIPPNRVIELGSQIEL